MPLSTHITTLDDAARVALVGELDLSTMLQFHNAVRGLVQDAEVRTVVVDLSGLTFLDSAGISALIRCKRLADGGGKKITISGAVGQVDSLITVTGLIAFLAE